jgi:hypothetical protein
MLKLLSLLPTILSLLSTIVDLFRSAQMRREAREVAGAELAKKEAEATREAAVIATEHRPDTDAADRMRDGTF